MEGIYMRLTMFSYSPCKRLMTPAELVLGIGVVILMAHPFSAFAGPDNKENKKTGQGVKVSAKEETSRFQKTEQVLAFEPLKLGKDEQQLIRERFNGLYVRYKENPGLITNERIKRLGFEKVDDLNNIMLDQPMEVFWVRLDQLRLYEVGDDPVYLLIPASSPFVPVKAGDNPSQVRSFAILIPPEEPIVGKQFIRVGPLINSQWYHLLIRARSRLATKYNIPQNAVRSFAIWNKSRNRYFLGDITSGAFMIQVLVNGPGNLKEGDFLSAKDVFAELAKEANEGIIHDYESPFFPRDRGGCNQRRNRDEGNCVIH